MEPNFSMELKLISCKDLTAFNFFQKLTLYALAFIQTNHPKTKLTEQQKQQQRTLTHRDGDDDGSSPEWNHEIRFDLGLLSNLLDSATDLFFHFEFRHEGLILGDKLIGECRVPLTDLIRDADGVTRFVSYEVRSGDGKPNGIFNFSYKLKGIGTHTSSHILDGRISGYPVLAPEDYAVNQQNQLHVPYPMSEIVNTCCYPTVSSVNEGLLYPPPPPPQPPICFPSSGEYHCYYPPPPPPPTSYPYPPPPPPPVEQYYPSFGPRPNPWPSGPYLEHRW